MLGAGNPTQVAGSAGTQSGVIFTPPTVLAEADVVLAELASAEAPQTMAEPVRVASFVDVAEVEEVATVIKTAAAPADTAAPARKRSHAERTAKRNSRSYRVAAARQKQKRDVPAKAVAVAAAAPRATEKTRIITQDGTNDMSVFSRHVYAGQERLASRERQPRRPAYTSRYAMRDDDNG
jgi:hypothetical protein